MPIDQNINKHSPSNGIAMSRQTAASVKPFMAITKSEKRNSGVGFKTGRNFGFGY